MAAASGDRARPRRLPTRAAPGAGRSERLLALRERAGALRDLYGPLLTARQRQLLRLCYDEDLSLAEAARRAGVSRQGVHDTLRRAMAALEAYERRLHLAERRDRRRERWRRLCRLLEQAAAGAGSGQRALLLRAQAMARGMADD